MRKKKSKLLISDLLLKQEFVDGRLAPQKIAQKYQVSIHAIKHRIRGLGLRRTSIDELLDKEKLYNEYIINNKSTTEISYDYGLSPCGSAVRHLLRKYGIKQHKFTLSNTVRKARDKTYIGFKGLSGSYYCVIKAHAREKSREINITPQYIWWLYKKQKARCIYSGIKIYFAQKPWSKNKRNQTASLDRIDSSMGYIIGNVQWVHKTIQKMKMELPDCDFIDLCNKISKYRGDL